MKWYPASGLISGLIEEGSILTRAHDRAHWTRVVEILLVLYRSEIVGNQLRGWLVIGIYFN